MTGHKHFFARETDMLKFSAMLENNPELLREREITILYVLENCHAKTNSVRPERERERERESEREREISTVAHWLAGCARGPLREAKSVDVGPHRGHFTFYRMALPVIPRPQPI